MKVKQIAYTHANLEYILIKLQSKTCSCFSMVNRFYLDGVDLLLICLPWFVVNDSWVKYLNHCTHYLYILCVFKTIKLTSKLWKCMIFGGSEMSCDIPPSVSNGYPVTNIDTTGPLPKVRFTCNPGYTLSGGSDFFCNKTSHIWFGNIVCSPEKIPEGEL